jgi:RHS repeat-associated protein
VPSFQYRNRVTQQSFGYDWLGNTVESLADTGIGYDRSLGRVRFGSTTAGPNQLISAGAGFKATYDAAGNLQGLTLQRFANAALSGPGTQRFAYDWDEVGRLSRARRWDFGAISAAELAQTSLPNTLPQIDLRYAYGLGGRVLATATAPDGTTSHTVTVFDSLRLNRTTFEAGSGDYIRSALVESVDLGAIGRVVHAPTLPRGLADNPQHVLLRFSDWLGSATSVVDKDTSELIEKVTYQAFGATESDYRPPRWNNSREDFRFSGKEDDFSVGLTFFGARYYHAALGRWASPDPLVIHSVVGSLNPYQYARCNPNNVIDMIGLSDECKGKENVCGDGPPGIGTDPGDFWNNLFGGSSSGSAGPGSPTVVVGRFPGRTATGSGSGGLAPPIPLPPIIVGTSATGVFDPKAGISHWDPTYWILEGDFSKSDRDLEYLQYGVAATTVSVVTLGVGVELAGGVGAISAAVVEIGPVIRPLVLSAQIGMYKAADVVNEISLAEQGISVRGFAVRNTTSVAANGGIADTILKATRTGSGLKSDSWHIFASFATKQELQAGRTFPRGGRDLLEGYLLQTKVEGGIYEYIVDELGFVVHQWFIPGGVITGFPNQVP